ncbi:hypothetical protein ACMHYO_16130 [Allopusillimonas ginsengisoli]|uniref:hypothetical protein n=1 Tax=Allopusillimonas ginsengisoli TaxID=453575 RepID=UPI0039C46BD2
MDVFGLISGITQTISIYKTAVETLDAAKITTATNELNVQLMQLGAEVLSMQKDGVKATERECAHLRLVDELSNKVRELEKRISERERYELVEDYPGTFTLRIKESARNGEPVHHLCPGCMDNKDTKSILQLNGPESTHGRCLSCKGTYQFKPHQPLMRYRDHGPF